jgi:hypothetical protein
MARPNPILVDFLKTIANETAGYLSFLALPGRRHFHFQTDDLESAASFAKHASDQRQNIYVRANVQGDAVGTTAATVSIMTILTLDFDIAGPGHNNERPLPTSFGDLFSILEKADVPLPTQLLKTGGGLLGIWGLEDPIVIASEADRARAKALSRKFQCRIAQVAKDLSMHVDATFDLVRACRLPGTRNWKTAYGDAGAPVEMYQ